MASTLTNLLYHLVFSTKNRFPMIKESLTSECHAYLGGIAKKEGCIPLAIGGMPDHVHVILKCEPTLALSDLVRTVKGSSSKWINEHYDVGGRFSWQEGYGAFTVSESQLQATINYVKNQERHHSQQGFQDEYRKLLDKHGVNYDERYLWG